MLASYAILTECITRFQFVLKLVSENMLLVKITCVDMLPFWRRIISFILFSKRRENPWPQYRLMHTAAYFLNEFQSHNIIRLTQSKSTGYKVQSCITYHIASTPTIQVEGVGCTQSPSKPTTPPVAIGTIGPCMDPVGRDMDNFI